MRETTLNPELRYLIRAVPSEGPLRCEVCGSEILSSEELTAAHESTADIQWILEVVIVDHLQLEHGRLFELRPAIVFTNGNSEMDETWFPDREVARSHAHADHKEAPPRSPDEKNE